MANTIKTCDLITKEFKRVFENNCPFINSMRRNYDDYHKVKGAKSGEAIRIQKPMKYSVRSGKTMDVQDHTETESTLTKSEIRGIDLKFSWSETEHDLEGVMRDHVRPAAAVLGSTVDNYCLDLAAKQVYNTITIPTTSIDRADIAAAGEMLTDFATPENDRFGVISTGARADLQNAEASLYNPTKSISRMYTEGYIGKIFGFDLSASPNIASITNTADVQSIVNGASQTGSSLTVDNTSVAPAQGMVCTIGDDVFALNPVTQLSLGKLQRFVIGSGATTTSLPITPAITVTGNQKTVSAVPDNDDTVDFVGSASTAYPRMMFYHRDAFAFGTIDVRAPKDLTSVTNTEGNLSMTFTTGGDIINMDTYNRLDIQFGFVTHIPEWAVQVFDV
jgi:hypothetical protein